MAASNVLLVSVLATVLYHLSLASLEPSDGNLDPQKLLNVDDVSTVSSKASVKVKSVLGVRPASGRGIPDFNRIADSLLNSKSRYESILSGTYLQADARAIAQKLREVANDHLCTIPMQAALDVGIVPPSTLPPAQAVEQIAQRLASKVEHHVLALDKLAKAIGDLHLAHTRIPLSQPKPCCRLDPHLLKFDSNYDLSVSKDFSCDLLPHSLPENVFLPGRNLTSVFRENLLLNPSLKWQYFISSDGVHTEFPAYVPLLDSGGSCRHEADHRHREVYLQTLYPYPKQVVLVLDHSSGMSPFQLLMAQVIGKHILATLSHHDRVGIIGLSSEVQFPQSGGCHPQQMANVTHEAKFIFSRFIDSLHRSQDQLSELCSMCMAPSIAHNHPFLSFAPNVICNMFMETFFTEPANHLLGFQKAFEMLRSVMDFNSSDHNSEALILYISRGLLSSIADARVILENIAHENQKTGNKVAINTYMIVEEGKPVMYEKTFLQDISTQNFSKYHVHVPSNNPAKRGLLVEVNSTGNLAASLDNFLSVLSHPVSKSMRFSLPHWDSVGKGLVVRMTRPVESEGNMLGVAGVDVPFSSLAESVTYFGHPPSSYAFLVDSESGTTIMHPSFPRPTYATSQPMHTELWNLEPHLKSFQQKLLSENVGEEKIQLKNRDGDEQPPSVMQYNWHKVPGSPYMVFVVTLLAREEYKGVPSAEGPREEQLDLTYHRFDLLPPKKPCRHVKQLSTLEMSTVFLSASCFLSPYEYLSQEESKQRAQSYMAYLTDRTKLIANPGLKSSVRNDVLTLAPITKIWKEKLDQDFSKYVVRRYVAMQSGVFLSYPGMIMEKSFDPSKRDWFLRAQEFPGKVVLSAPYLDISGAGYIITLSVTLFEGKYASMHSPEDKVVGVMAMDLTLGYFYMLLLDTISVCEQDRITCFLLDDKGYLVAHPSLVEPSGRPNSEQLHITHKEPLVASDILNHKTFAHKKVCNSYSDRSMQRFYQFNISLEASLTNLVHGESCAKYIITAVPGTNLFLGFVNQTCDVTTTFCPCSTTDRLCLNCHRMEQTECECPCECPLEINLCSGHLLAHEEHASCPRVPEESHLPPTVESTTEGLDSCLAIQCQAYATRRDCLGLLGCEWCQIDSDGTTTLRRQFCTEQRKCFGGVLGSRTPYADEIIGLPGEDYFSSKSSPVGPVTGGIIGCFLVLAVAFYLYHHHHSHRMHGTSSEFIASGCRAPHTLNATQDDNGGHLEDDSSHPGHSNVVLASFENAVVVSPYRLAGYRRRAGGDSDPGYSTMTPHDDCEMVPSIEPLLLGKDRHKVAPSSTSGCSRSSSPPPLTPPKLSPPGWGTKTFGDPSQTVLTQVPHAVVTQVQVHVADVC